MVCTPRQPHRPRHLASKARRVFSSCVLLRRLCRNLCQTNGAATSTSSVRSRFITRSDISASLMTASSHPLDIYTPLPLYPTKEDRTLHDQRPRRFASHPDPRYACRCGTGPPTDDRSSQRRRDPQADQGGVGGSI